MLKRRPWGIAGAVILLLVILVAALAPIITPYPPNQANFNHRLQPPGAGHILGTDNLGRHIFSRLLYSSRPYAQTALIAIGIATVLGILLGFISARIGGKTDAILRRAVPIPAFLFIAVILISILGAPFHISPVLILAAPMIGQGLFAGFIGLLLSFVALPSVFALVRETWLSTTRPVTLALIPLT